MKTKEDIEKRISNLQKKLKELDKIMVQCKGNNRIKIATARQQVIIAKELAILYWVLH